MMHQFLSNNRAELIARCKTKVAARPRRAATEEQLKNGIPLFLEQLRRTLQAEEADEGAESLRISGASGGDALLLSEVGVSAAAHGGQLLQLGFSVDQVVHDYGDLCQAITELAFERDAPFAVPEFRTLNRCLDNAIADAVTEFSAQRDATISLQQAAAVDERIGFLVHELRNSLGTAMLAVAALEHGNLPVAGATGALLKRSLAGLKILIDRSLDEVRQKDVALPEREFFSLASFIEEGANAAEMHAATRGCTLAVAAVDPSLAIHANRVLLLAALTNLMQNAVKFTKAGTQVRLQAYATGDVVRIEVADHCGGLPSDSGENLFTPFTQRGSDQSGVGLGLSIARQTVKAEGGTLTVRNLPGTGCVFTICLPRHLLQ